MAIIPTTTDLTALGAYDISKVRGDFVRTGAGTPGFPGGLYETFIDGSEALCVDGSGAAVAFGWGPDDTAERWAFMGFRALISDGSANFDGVHFGETGPCATGVLIQVNRQSTGVVQTFDTILVNPDWGHLAGADVVVLPFGKADDCMLVNVDFRDHEKFIFEGSQGDVFQVTIQDDLTALTMFRIYCWGYKV
jgi:hypothetical protein